MDAICAVRLDLTPLAERVAADVEAARGNATPGGTTVTAEERDTIERRTEAAITAIGNELLAIPHPCSAIAGGIMLRGARETAKGVVKELLDGPAPSQPPRPQAPRAPAEPSVRPRGRVIDV